MKSKLFKFFVKLEFLLATVLIVLISDVLSSIVSKVNILNSLEYSFADFDFTDLIYSKLAKDTTVQLDTNIVVVNIGTLDRKAMGDKLAIIAKAQPKVVGADVLFVDDRGEEDSTLINALKECKNVVLIGAIDMSDSTLYTSHPKFLKYAKRIGNNRLITDDVLEGQDHVKKSLRRFINRQAGKDTTLYAFGVEIMRLFDSTKVNKFLSRGYKEEIINFSGSQQKFKIVEIEELSDSTIKTNIFKDKIVLLGYTGENYVRSSLQFGDGDMYFTPMNEDYTGRAFLDTYGVIVYANIISMLISESWIGYSKTLERTLDFLILLLVVLMLSYIFRRSSDYYGLLSKLFVLLIINILVISSIYIYKNFSFKIDFRIAILYLLLAPDIYEFYQHIIVKPCKKWVISFLQRSGAYRAE